ncbi:hypothetical protein BC833DRAFT_602680 [Globomyces pollinis-pini]|nr:hypothetical protein BC833DRAFT_602680 [Globomyces pollinis-pini]
MKIIGMGIDILDLNRMSKIINKVGVNRLALRILHNDEIISLQRTNDKLRFMGTRWALKESLYKAFSSNKKLTWKDARVTHSMGTC